VSENLLTGIIDEVKLLLKQSADRQGRIHLSPEVAEALSRIQNATSIQRLAVQPTISTVPVEPVSRHPATAIQEPAVPVATPGQDQAPASAPASTPTSAPGEAITGFALAKLAEQVRVCKKCSLCETRTQTVFGTGTPYAKIVFVGEAPGEEEDRRGEPFVGRAGELLTGIITKGMGLRREDVYICNVLKCRPPDNRTPNPAEVQQCEPYLIRQLELIKPKVICALGGVAAKCLLNTDDSVGKLRKSWHEYQGIPLRVTYHPAYLLRSPNMKKACWEDIQEIMRFLDIPIPPKDSKKSSTE